MAAKASAEVVSMNRLSTGYDLDLRVSWLKPITRQFDIVPVYSNGIQTGAKAYIAGTTEEVEIIGYEQSDGSTVWEAAYEGYPEFFDLELTIEDDDLPMRRIRKAIRRFVADELTDLGLTIEPNQVLVKRLDDPDEDIVAKTIRLHDGDPLGPPRLPTTVGTNVYVKRMAESVPVGSTDAETMAVTFAYARTPNSPTVLQWRICAFADDGSVRRSDLGTTAQPVWQGVMPAPTGSKATATFDLSLPAQEPLVAAGRVLLVPAIRRITTGSANLRAAGLIGRAVVKLES